MAALRARQAAEILKAPEEDPRAADGVLERVTGFLLTLVDEQ